MTKNEKAHLEANYKMHVEHMLKAEDAAKKNPGDKELEYAVIAHRNIVFGHDDAAVTVLINTICNRREYTTADLIAAAEKNFKALWAESVEESDPGTAKAIQVQASKVALTYFIALTRNWMGEVESDLNSRRR